MEKQNWFARALNKVKALIAKDNTLPIQPNTLDESTTTEPTSPLPEKNIFAPRKNI